MIELKALRFLAWLAFGLFVLSTVQAAQAGFSRGMAGISDYNLSSCSWSFFVGAVAWTAAAAVAAVSKRLDSLEGSSRTEGPTP